MNNFGQREVDFDLFLEMHTELADWYRAQGLTGDRLDYAIDAHLPHWLERVLDGKVVWHHRREDLN